MIPNDAASTVGYGNEEGGKVGIPAVMPVEYWMAAQILLNGMSQRRHFPHNQNARTLPLGDGSNPPTTTTERRSHASGRECRVFAEVEAGSFGRFLGPQEGIHRHLSASDAAQPLGEPQRGVLAAGDEIAQMRFRALSGLRKLTKRPIVGKRPKLDGMRS